MSTTYKLAAAGEEASKVEAALKPATQKRAGQQIIALVGQAKFVPPFNQQ
jgi:hypothetical protein